MSSHCVTWDARTNPRPVLILAEGPPQPTATQLTAVIPRAGRVCVGRVAKHDADTIGAVRGRDVHSHIDVESDDRAYGPKGDAAILIVQRLCEPKVAVMANCVASSCCTSTGASRRKVARDGQRRGWRRAVAEAMDGRPGV